MYRIIIAIALVALPFLSLAEGESNESRIIDSLQQKLNAAASDTMRLRLLNTIAVNYRTAHEWDKSMTCIRQALDIGLTVLSTAGDDQLPALQREAARTFDCLGNIYLDKLDYTKALANHTRSLQVRQAMNDKQGIANALNNIALVYHEQVDRPNAMHYYFESLRMAEQVGDSSTMANVLNNIGLIHEEQGQIDNALKYQLRSLEIEEKMNSVEGVATSLNNIGLLYFDKKDYPKALDYFNRSLKLKEQVKDKQGIANSYNNIALVYDEKGEYEKALEYNKRSMEIEEQLQNRKGVAMSLGNIGYTYQSMGDLASALEYGKRSLEICNETGALEQSVETELLLSEVYEKMGSTDLALKHYRNYIVARDSMFNEGTTRQVVQAEMNFEFDKKAELAKLEQEKREALHEEALKRQRVITGAMAGGGGLLLLLALVAFKGYRQKRKANELLAEKNILIEEKNKDITSSIRYAKRIQEAILPPKEVTQRLFPQSFILYKPKDIVCGDFYWMEQRHNKLLFAAVDCTGHGVPGAFMSLVGFNLLNQAVNEFGLTEPAKILDAVNKNITATLRQDYEDSLVRDGMDIALCVYDKDTRVLQFAGAYNPLWIVRNNELIQLQGDKFPVGIFISQEMKKFTGHEIELQAGDVLYVFSDGYYDQFGGDKQKKMTRKKFRELILSIHHEPVEKQHSILEDTFSKWKGDLEQVDDVLVIGVKI